MPVNNTTNNKNLADIEALLSMQNVLQEYHIHNNPRGHGETQSKNRA